VLLLLPGGSEALSVGAAFTLSSALAACLVLMLVGGGERSWVHSARTPPVSGHTRGSTAITSRDVKIDFSREIAIVFVVVYYIELPPLYPPVSQRTHRGVVTGAGDCLWSFPAWLWAWLVFCRQGRVERVLEQARTLAGVAGRTLGD